MAGHNPGRQLANSIIGKEGGSHTPAAPESLETPSAGTKHSFHRISVRPQSDGSIRVDHEAAPPNYDAPGPMENEVTSTHATAADAHAHIGKLMGATAAPPQAPHVPKQHVPGPATSVPKAK